MEIDSGSKLGRSGATWFMLALTAAVTAMPVTSAVGSLLKAAGVVDVKDDVVVADDLGALGFFDERGIRVAEGMAAVVSVPVAVSSLIVLLGLLRWKEWAREAALGVFGLIGAFLLILSVNGLTFDERPRYAAVGVVLSLAVLGVAAMVLTPGVRDDFEARRLQKALREREALTAARRARQGQAGSSSTSSGTSTPSR